MTPPFLHNTITYNLKGSNGAHVEDFFFIMGMAKRGGEGGNQPLGIGAAEEKKKAVGEDREIERYRQRKREREGEGIGKERQRQRKSLHGTAEHWFSTCSSHLLWASKETFTGVT